MKKFYSLFVLMLTTFAANAQFGPGDIAFTTYNSDGATGIDTFSFVSFVDIEIDDSISFTDNGWFGAGGFRSGESHLKIVFISDYPCGTEFLVFGTSVYDHSFSDAAVTEGSALVLSASGDQIFAYDAGNQPTAGDESGFITGIHSNTATWEADATSSNASAKPSILTDGIDCFAIPEVDNAQFDCSVLTAVTTAAIVDSIYTLDNWNTDNLDAFDGVLGCDITCPPASCTDPDVPALSGPASICDGDDATITITGALNDATQWVVYIGACGGVPVATTTTSSFDVSPSSDETYYVRGEGGCVTPGSCASILVTVNPSEDGSFTYPAATYCDGDTDPVPTITGDAGGDFTGTPGLVVDISTGEIDLGGSTAGDHTITYTTSTASCAGVETFDITIGASNTGTQTETACNEFTWAANSTTYSATGMYMATLTNASGCDSVVTLDLTIETVDVGVSETAVQTATADAAGMTYQWLDCDDSYAEIPGATDQSFVASSHGNYAVIVTDGACSDTSDCVLLEWLSLEEISNTFEFYPNPTQNNITFATNSNEAHVIEVRNIVGQLVRTYNTASEKFTFALPEEKGIYFISVLNDKGVVVTEKVTKL